MESYSHPYNQRQSPHRNAYDVTRTDRQSQDRSPSPHVRKLPRLASWQSTESQDAPLFLNRRTLPPPNGIPPGPEQHHSFGGPVPLIQPSYHAPRHANPHTQDSAHRPPPTNTYSYATNDTTSQSAMCFGRNTSARSELQPRPVMKERAPQPVTRAPYPYSTASSHQASSASSVSSYYDPVDNARLPRPSWHSARSVEPLLTSTTWGMPPAISSVKRITITDYVPNLLGEDRAHLLPNITFSLVLRQQPERVRACGFADRDRRAIDPPPILELVIRGEGLTPEDIRKYQMYKYMTYCSIIDEAGNDAVMMDNETARAKRIIGELSATTFFGKDDNGVEGCFFSFSDLSVRTTGEYRLTFSAMIWPCGDSHLKGRLPRVAKVNSEVFKSYNAKNFPGMTESSSLARALKDQGCNIPVRKGNERGKSSPRAGAPDEDDEDDE